MQFLKTLFTYFAGLCAGVLFFSSCKTNKNTVVHRAFHNMTARYNGYYYATESIKEGVEKIENANKDDYDKLLSVFVTPSNEAAKATFPEFDKAIKKSSLVIQRHTIRDKKGNEIYTAGHWIDNNWIVIGISHFYKREFFSGIEAFEYVIRSYKTKDKYKAMLWLAKSYNEIGAVSQAEPVLTLMKNDKSLTKSAKKELQAVQADYYLKRGQYLEAEQSLLRAVNSTPKYLVIFDKKKKRSNARYCFILGQLYERDKNYKKAIQYYDKCIGYKPNYDMVFNAQIKQARLFDTKKGNSGKLKKQLLKMTKDIKNKEYLDVIYYTLGEIEEKDKNVDLAMADYRKSVKYSTVNPKQKALSYLKLGEISFDRANYPASGAYYDSTMNTLPKDYPDYDVIDNRKKTLQTLVGYITTIQREDSLQRIARMGESQRNTFIDKVIKRLEEEEQRKKEEQELLAQQNQTPANQTGTPGLPTMAGSAPTGAWYFYNQTTLSFGVNDFIKKWGTRKLEDNWRRSQKGLSFDNGNPSDSTDADNSGKSTKAIVKNKKSRDYYMKDLPMTDSLMKVSDNNIIEAYYNMGSLYRESLNNNKKAIASFEELNKRYADNKYKLSIYYHLYRIYTVMKNQNLADYYKNKLLDDYPDSEYAQIIKNPNYNVEHQAKKGEVETFYIATYDTYEKGGYAEALQKCREAEAKFGTNNDFAPKFGFIKAVCIGKTKGVDSLEASLKQLQVLYPKDNVSVEAQDILSLIYDMKHPDSGNTLPPDNNTAHTDTFSLNLGSQHFVILICPDNSSIADPLKSSLGNFNNSFYTSASLAVSSSLFGASDQLIIVKSFKNAEEAMGYLSNLGNDKTVFSGKVKKELVTIMAISADNLPIFYKKKKVSSYKPFYDDHYQLSK